MLSLLSPIAGTISYPYSDLAPVPNLRPSLDILVSIALGSKVEISILALPIVKLFYIDTLAIN